MSNETKQTAVQWYSERLYDLEMAYNQNVIETDIYIKSKIQLKQQAKEMEKEQHEKTYNQSLMSNFPTFEDYYNETYGGNK